MKRSEGVKKKKWFRRLRLPQVIYMLFFVASIIYVSNRGGAFSYALFFTTLCYPPLALFYLLYMRSTIRIYQELPVREMKKNVDEPYELTLENAGFLPSSGIILHSYKGRALFGEDMTGQWISLLPREKAEYKTTLSCKYAGSYAAGISMITFQDCFGLFRLKMKIPTPLFVQVLPMVNPDRSAETSRALLELAAGASGGRMLEKEDILGNDMAPYTPGDPLKRIHWKNYARSGELFVRLPEEKDLQLISVVLFTRPIVESEEGKEEDMVKELMRRDLFLDTAVSVAAYFAEQKRPVQFFFYNAGIVRVLVENYEGLQNLSRELSKALVLRGDVEGVDRIVAEEAGRWQCPIMNLVEKTEISA